MIGDWSYACALAVMKGEPVDSEPRVHPIDTATIGDQFRLLIQSVSDYAIFMLDENGIVRSWNAGARRIKGYEAEEIIGRHLSVFYPPADVSAGKFERLLATATAEGHVEDEGLRIRKDGTTFWANVVITALRDESGKMLGFAKVTRDLTDRHERERAQLELAEARGEQRLRDEFLAMISHELRTPLNSIVGWSSLLHERIKDPEDRKVIGTVLRSARAQAKLIDDLLDMSRSIAGKLTVDRLTVDVTTVAHEVIEALTPVANASKLALVLEATGGSLVIGDVGRIRQALMNVVGNAVKFTKEGSIRVVVTRDDAHVVITVIDSGVGIAPAFLPRVFERFQQADGSRTREFGGLGLGLAIARDIVLLHDGTMSVESDGVGHGARVSIQLPRSVSPPSESAQPAGAPSLVGARLLVVEDDVDSRELIVMVLEGKGAEVLAVSDAPSARAAVKAFDPHLVLSDIGLPGEDGYQLLRSLRDMGIRAPAIALSGYSGDTTRARATQAGFVGILSKPYELTEVVTLLARLVQVTAS
ncbi:hypothetical protein BH09MYX1_BH09MYX1_51550 [soil metagenome]